MIFDGGTSASLTAGAINLNVEQVTVEADASVTGSSVEFDMDASGNGLIPEELLTDGFILAAPHAEILIQGTVEATAGDVVLTADSTTNVNSSSFSLGLIGGAINVALPSAEITVDGGTVRASGGVDVDANVALTISADDEADSNDNQSLSLIHI